MLRLHFLLKRAHWPQDCNIGLQCYLSEDDGCWGFGFRWQQWRWKEEDEFGKYCETHLAGLVWIFQWEMQETKAFGMTSRFSSLGNPSSGQPFLETGEVKIDTGQGQMRNRKPSKDCVRLDNNITVKSRLECIRSMAHHVGTGRVNDTSSLPERTRQSVVRVFLW